MWLTYGKSSSVFNFFTRKKACAFFLFPDFSMCLFELCKYELRDGHGGRECQEFLVGDFLGDGVDLLLRLLFIGQRLDGCEGGANGHHQHVKAFLFRGGGLRGERRCVGIHGCLCVTSFVSTVHFNFLWRYDYPEHAAHDWWNTKKKREANCV